MTIERQEVHSLVARLAPSQLAAVRSLLKVMLDPVSRAIANAPADDEPESLAQAQRFEMPDPPSVGTCNRCGYHGAVYPGRYGGQRCAVCFGLQHGWMPKGA